MDLAEVAAPISSARALAASQVSNALRLRADERVQVGEAQAGHVGVLGRGDDADAVDPDLQLDEVDAVLLADGGLLLVDRARGVGDVDLAVAQKTAMPSPVPGPSTS